VQGGRWRPRALGRETFCLETTRRPVAIEAGIWTPQTKQAVLRDGNTGAERVETMELGLPGDVKRTLRELLVCFLQQTPAERRRGQRNNLVLAVPMKRNIIEYAGLLADLYVEDAEVRAILDANKATDLLEERIRSLEPSGRQAVLQRILPLGIGLHDADLSLEERRLVGEAFRDGEIAVLLCTSTMAQGVNLPCQSIVFLNWGSRPYAPPGLPEREPFYKTLEADFINWLGRVGRFGRKGHRPPTALYVASHSPNSEEVCTIQALLSEEKGRLTTALAEIPSFSGPLLSTLLSLEQAGITPSYPQIARFLLSTPTADDPAAAGRLLERALAGLRELGGFALAPDTTTRQGCLEENVPLIGPDEDEASLQAIRRVEGEGTPAFALTGLGRAAYAHGVAIETCRSLYRWVREQAGSEGGWDPLDPIALVLQTTDGAAVSRLRVKSASQAVVRAAFARHVEACATRLGAGWRERSPLPGVQDVATQATLLAMRDWREGAPEYEDAGIEAVYGLNLYGTTLPRKAREIGRLLHVLEAVAALLPAATVPPSRPETLPPLSEGFLAVPYDLAALAEEVVQGLPQEMAALARLGIEGLGRFWALRLYASLQEHDLAPDLPVLERLQALAEDEDRFRAALPIHGLRERIKDQLCSAQSIPLAESLRRDPGLIARYYGYPLVIAAQLAQGRDRYTAFRLAPKDRPTYLRRNAVRQKPIVVQEAGDLACWLDRGAVEVLAETGRAFADGYRMDRFFVDLDPRAGYALESLKSLALEALRRLEAHDWVEGSALQVHWTGGKGFHLIAPFRKGVFRPVEPVKRTLEGLLARLCNDRTIFLQEQSSLFEPHVILDLMPVMPRGLARNPFSLNAGTGNVCVPVERHRLRDFDPAREATPQAVLRVMDAIARSTRANARPIEESELSYEELLALYHDYVRFVTRS